MPIYEYRCAECGHQKEFLQRMSDAPLTECTQCHAAAFSKQLTAPGFQLKGNGWYASDFKGAAAKPQEESASAATPCGGSCACH